MKLKKSLKYTCNIAKMQLIMLGFNAIWLYYCVQILDNEKYPKYVTKNVCALSFLLMFFLIRNAFEMWGCVEACKDDIYSKLNNLNYVLGLLLGHFIALMMMNIMIVVVIEKWYVGVIGIVVTIISMMLTLVYGYNVKKCKILVSHIEMKQK